MTDKPYEQWLAERRRVAPPATLADRIMSQVADLDGQRQDVWWLGLILWIERSRTARWAVSSGALAIGGLPFVFLVYVARIVAF